MSTAVAPSLFGQQLRLMWINTSGRPCPGPLGGCEARNEVLDTMQNWVARGLPRTGWSFCKDHCHCILLPMIDFGLGITDDLRTGDIEWDLSEVEPPVRRKKTPFAAMGDGYDPETFVNELERLPLIGVTQQLIDQLIADFVNGHIDFKGAKARADLILRNRPTEGDQAEGD